MNWRRYSGKRDDHMQRPRCEGKNGMYEELRALQNDNRVEVGDRRQKNDK